MNRRMEYLFTSSYICQETGLGLRTFFTSLSHPSILLSYYLNSLLYLILEFLFYLFLRRIRCSLLQNYLHFSIVSRSSSFYALPFLCVFLRLYFLTPFPSPFIISSISYPVFRLNLPCTIFLEFLL